MHSVARSQRMIARDRVWRGAHSTTLIQPIDAPSVDAVRWALGELSRVIPDHKIFHRLDEVSARWVAVPAAEHESFIQRMVVDLTAVAPGAATNIATIIERFHAEKPDDLPFRVGVGVDFLTASLAHPVADWSIFQQLVADVVNRSLGRPTSTHLDQRSIRFPLVRALAACYRSEPGRLRHIHEIKQARPEAAADTLVPFRPELAVVSDYADLDAVTSVLAWRKQHATGTSRATILLTATRIALESVGLAPASAGELVVMDARRYLPRKAFLDGNFVVGVYVEPSDPHSPVALERAMEASRTIGGPLVLMAGYSARAAVRRGGAHPARIAPHPHPELALSHLGRPKVFNTLPWTVAPEKRTVIVGTTPSPAGITASLIEVNKAFQVSFSFNASTFDRDLVRRAARRLVSDPVGLLSDTYREGS
jgi:hypothetical protein